MHASTHAHPHPTQSVLYLATDQGADKALEPDGFATLQASAGASGAQALKHVPMDVKVMVWTCVGGVEREDSDLNAPSIRQSHPFTENRTSPTRSPTS